MNSPDEPTDAEPTDAVPADAGHRDAVLTGPVWAAADPGVLALFGLWPIKGDNPVGWMLHQDYVQLTMAAVPGSWTGYIAFASGDKFSAPYRQLFFAVLGGLDRDGYAESYSDVDPSMWNPTSTPVRDLLGAGWWQSFSILLVTEAIANVVTSVAPLIDLIHVQGDRAAMMPSLLASAQAGYRLEFAAHYGPQLTAATAKGRDQALATYQGLLTSSAWVTLSASKAVLGQWSDGPWELFHHAVKLMLLGATAADVTAVLTQLEHDFADQNASLPADFTAATWQKYTQFLPDPVITGTDLADGIGQPANADPPTSPGRVGLTQADNEGNLMNNNWVSGAISRDFVKNVATGYYLPPKGSCFTGTTRVLLPDGSDRALTDLHPGVEVWTPDGPRPVRVAVRTSRLGRTLYRVDGSTFALADSHPLVDGHDHAASLGVHAARTAAFSPGLTDGGVSELAPGALAARVRRDGAVTAAPITAVQGVPALGAVDEELMDLILEPGEHGFPAFAVGDGGDSPFYLVRSEVLRYEAYDAGTLAGLVMLAGAASTCCAAMAALEPDQTARVAETVQRLAHRLVADAVAAVPAVDPAAAAGLDLPVHERLSAMLGAFTTGADSFDWRLGALHEALAVHVLVPIHHAALGGWRPACVDPASATWCAVTIHDIVLPPRHARSGDWKLEMLVDGRTVAETTTNSAGLSHRLTPGWTVPTAVACRDGHLHGRDLTLRLLSPDGQWLTGTASLPRQCPAPGHDGQLTLRGARGSSHGASVRYDLRPLDSAIAATHPQHAPQTWGPHARTDYANRLGLALGQLLNERFPAIVMVGSSSRGRARHAETAPTDGAADAAR